MSRRGFAARLPLVLAALAVAFATWLFSPPSPRTLASRPRPSRTHDEAVARFERLLAREPADLNPICHGRLLDHGRRTERAVVLIHGLTNCPQQFDSLGRVLYERGANVLIARIPHHGLADRMTRDLGRLHCAELVAWGDEITDIGRGLGDRVTVAGLSLGGTLSAWLGQERDDVDRAIVIAPVFGFSGVPVAVTPVVARAFLALPDPYPWWDSKQKEKVGGPPYAYPRFSIRAAGETLRLGFAVMERARRAPPKAASLVTVTVAGDPAIANAAALAMHHAWERHAPDRVRAYEFGADVGVAHDLIDPLQPYQKVARVYPVLAEMMLANDTRP